MEITIKMEHGLGELAGMFAGMMNGGYYPPAPSLNMAPAPPLPQSEEDMMEEDVLMEQEKKKQEEESGRIREIRMNARMSQDQFSRAYGIPKRTIENWESGTRKPPEYVINLLEKAVEADVKIAEMKKQHTQEMTDIVTGRKAVRYNGKRVKL